MNVCGVLVHVRPDSLEAVESGLAKIQASRPMAVPKAHGSSSRLKIVKTQARSMRWRRSMPCPAWSRRRLSIRSS
ncbi:MAG TPA: hypothetical protein PK405_00635, partial [Hyphomicrobiales bacterium]|nr:hypothetical protein [Hyphomicrobiales bacterium]